MLKLKNQQLKDDNNFVFFINIDEKIVSTVHV